MEVFGGSAISLFSNIFLKSLQVATIPLFSDDNCGLEMEGIDLLSCHRVLSSIR